MSAVGYTYNAAFMSAFCPTLKPTKHATEFATFCTAKHPTIDTAFISAVWIAYRSTQYAAKLSAIESTIRYVSYVDMCLFCFHIYSWRLKTSRFDEKSCG